MSGALIGGITFLLASPRRVAEHCQAGAGLFHHRQSWIVVACAGHWNYSSLWGAILLLRSSMPLPRRSCSLLRHHRARNRQSDIEQQGLISASRRWRLQLIGIRRLCSWRPFGMLISKWVTPKSFRRASIRSWRCCCFRSAPTLFFWAKWMGKLIAVPFSRCPHLAGSKRGVDFPDGLAISHDRRLLPVSVDCPGGYRALNLYLYGPRAFVEPDNILIMSLIWRVDSAPAVLFPFSKDLKYVGPYLGAAMRIGQRVSGIGRTGARTVIRNLYFRAYFKEKP